MFKSVLTIISLLVLMQMKSFAMLWDNFSPIIGETITVSGGEFHHAYQQIMDSGGIYRDILDGTLRVDESGSITSIKLTKELRAKIKSGEFKGIVTLTPSGKYAAISRLDISYRDPWLKRAVNAGTLKFLQLVT